MQQLGYIGQETIEASVEKLKAEAASWQNLYNDFVSAQPPSNSPYFARWKTIYDAASGARLKIQSAFDAVGDAGSWIGRLFGLNGVEGMQGLGLLPIVVVGAALTAIAVTAVQMKGYLTEVARIDATAQLVREGKADGSLLAPQKSLFGNLEGMTKWIVLGGVAFVAWQFLRKRGSL